ncbi:hypothetical protein [Polaribacter uvawellassae]|jgi:hypothetical protein|uniref:hypothetical protein n=1 Tax=Polaribacter uvawellassae TaxID=3133495 RepID=UPI00321B9652
MGIRENYQTLKNALKHLYVKSEYISGENGGKPYLISDISNLKKGIELLENIDFLEVYINDLKENSGLFKTFKEKDSFNSTQDTLIKENINSLRTGIIFLLNYFDEQTVNEKDIDGISVKLPELGSFDELNKISNDLKKAIELPINDAGIENGKTEIVSAERGSIWLNIALGTAAAVKLVASITWAATYLRKKKAEAKIYEEYTKTLELKNDALSSIIDAQKQQLKNILEAEAQAIISEQYNHNDPETLKRLELSINTTADLIDRGVKILPTSENDSIKELFPDYKNLNLIQSAIKQIKNE